MAPSLLTLFNRLSPKDGGSRRIAADLAYGPGARHRLDLYAPRRMPAAPLPVIVFFYGGSWMEGDRSDYAFAARALAALGYVVAVPDYRVLPEVEYPAFLEDCAAAVTWLASEVAAYGGNGDRLVLMGHSAGAYNAAMLALDRRWLPAGVHPRVRALVGLSGPFDFFPFDGPISIRVFGTVPEPRRTQPLHHAGHWAPPTFLGHGADDPLVLSRNTVNLAAALRTAGVPVTGRVYARQGHPQPLLALGVVFRFLAPVLADIEAFLAEVLRA